MMQSMYMYIIISINNDKDYDMWNLNLGAWWLSAISIVGLASKNFWRNESSEVIQVDSFFARFWEVVICILIKACFHDFYRQAGG